MGKVSGINVLGRVLGMPELPDTKLLFRRPNAHNAQNYKSWKHGLKIVYSYVIEVPDSESDLGLCNRN